MRKKRLIAVTALVLAVVTILGVVMVRGVPSDSEHQDTTQATGEAGHDELYVRELLDGCSINTILDDPEWEASIPYDAANFVTVSADQFDFSKSIGITEGHTNIYFDTGTSQIHTLQHNYTVYTNEQDPEVALQDLIANLHGEIAALLGNPSQSFMLLTNSGAMEDDEDMGIDEMIQCVIADGCVLYIMYESNGLRYEMNITYSDDTVYSTVWIYDDSSMHYDAGGTE